MKASSKIKSINSLTPMQEGILYHHLENEQSSSYHLQTSVWVNNKLELRNIQTSLDLLAQRHEVLKTAVAIPKSTAKARQVILEDRQLAFEYLERHGSCPTAVETEIKEKDLAHRFDLQKDSLLRLKVISFSEDSYLFLFSFHHIIIDGWSVGIVFNDFFKYLEQLESGISKATLIHQIEEEKRNELSYSDYIKWFEKQDQEKGITYWSKFLADYEEPAEIKPVKEPISTNKQTATIGVNIEKELAAKLNDIASSNHLTINTIMEVAWGIVLQKFNHKNDVVFGKVVSGRNADLDGIEGMVGLFINAIPVRMESKDGMSVATLLRDVQNQAMDSINYDYCALAEIQNQTQLRSDLIKTLFVFENYYVNENNKGNKLQVDIKNTREQTNYDLNLIIYSAGDRLTCKLMYHPGKYETTEIQSILEKLEVVLQEMAIDINKKIKDIAMITPAEKSLILNEFNDAKRDDSNKKSVVQLFEEQVIVSPNQIAVAFEEEKITYRDLNEKANALAHQLREQGIRPNDYIAIATKKSIEMIIGILAILKSGGAYVPLDMLYPKKRLTYILDDCKPKVLLTHQEEIHLEVDVPVIELKNHDLMESSSENLNQVNSLNDLIYLIYTSGTTGKPKGVMVEHRNVVSLVKNTNYVEFNDVSIAQAGSFSFDASTFEVWGSLLNGGKVVLLPEEILLNATLLKEELIKKEVDTMFVTTALYNQLIGEDPQVFDPLKQLLFGGEATSEEHVRKLVSRNNELSFSNVYGPTESTTFTLYYPILDVVKEKTPIGKPISNREVYILSEGELCGIGVVGELYIGGEGVARGYLNLPELTAKKFIDNPYGEGKLYRTGDLVRWLSDGNIEYLGRIDEQVKIRGFRIELGEIESAFRKIEGITDAVVITKEDDRKEKSLHAYFVAKTDLHIDEIKDELRKTLPHYMIPSHMRQIEKIPFTLNGKLDRRALPRIEIKHQTTNILPRNESEEILSHLFKEILEIDQISIKDNFFELGGHSLRATRLVNRIESEMGRKVRLKEVMDHPTIEALAKMMTGKKAEEYVPIPIARKQTYYPMSSTQKRMYLLNQLDENSTTYNMPQAFMLSGNVKVACLKEAMEKIIARHEILRTTFTAVEGDLVQKVNEELPLEFSEVEDEQSQTRELLQDFIKPFDLNKGPLLRMRIIKREEAYFLFIDMHHIISDGMSIETFIQELVKLYHGDTLEPLTHQYKDYSEWMRDRDLSEQKDYWMGQFEEEVQALDMPLDYSRPPKQSFKGARIEKKISQGLTEQIKGFAQQNHVTEYMFFLSIIMILLGKYSNQEDVVIGSPIIGRRHRDTEKMLGMFANTLAMRGRPEGHKTYEAYLKEIKEMYLNAHENQEYPFEELIEEVVTQRDMSRNPLFDVMLAVQNDESAQVMLSGVKTEPIEIDFEVSKFDLTFSISETSEGYHLIAEYCTDLYQASTINKLIQCLNILIEQVISQPILKLEEIEMITAEEKELILSVFNDTQMAYPKEKTVIEVFEAQVEKNPDQIAVVFRDEKVTYEVLNKRANKIAHQLRSLDVKPNDCVALMTERSIDMIVGIYGILKAGGAYVPLDPTYPEERIKYILADSQPKALLTNQEYIKVTDIPVIEFKQMDERDEENLEWVNKPSDLTYLIYTSGTTGNPKGVMVEHRNVLSLVQWQKQIGNYTEATTILQNFNYIFDGSVWEIFPALSSGCTLEIIPEESRYDAKQLLALIPNKQIMMVPSIFKALIDYAEENNLEKQLHTFDKLYMGGEPLSYDLIERYKKMSGNQINNVFNAYGPTETTVCATCYQFDQTYDKILIGKPIGNTQVYIFVENQLCGIGRVGELCVGGDGITRGYLNQSELTQKKFRKNPFGEGHLYRTGDLARWLPDGNIEYLGRIDEQVKIRGFRIELGEIETRLREITAVQDVKVIVNKKDDDPYLCAYIVGKDELNYKTLESELKKKLPDYMIPNHFIQLDQLPLMKNGKVDMKKLSEIEVVPEAKVYILPRNELEATVHDIFKKVLGMDQISVDDRFIKLGGDSLKAAKVVNLIAQETNVKITLSSIFLKGDTVEDIAKEIEASRGMNDFAQLPTFIEEVI